MPGSGLISEQFYKARKREEEEEQKKKVAELESRLNELEKQLDELKAGQETEDPEEIKRKLIEEFEILNRKARR